MGRVVGEHVAGKGSLVFLYPIMKYSIFRLSFVLLGASALVLYAATGPESKTPALRIDASSVG